MLRRDDLQAVGLEAGVDLADHVLGHGIGLDDRQGALNRHLRVSRAEMGVNARKLVIIALWAILWRGGGAGPASMPVRRGRGTSGTFPPCVGSPGGGALSHCQVGGPRWLHAAARAHRNVDGTGALPGAALQATRGLRICRPGGRRADDPAGQEDHASQHAAGTDRLPEGQQGQGHGGQCRPWRGVAPVRHAVPDRDPDRPDDGAIQRHGAGDDRPARWPGRCAV